MRNQHDQALVAWQDTKAQADAEREAAAKETDTVRQNEKEFAKGIPAGLLYGTAAGFAWIGDRLNWLVKNYKNDPDVLMPALEDLAAKHLESKSEAYKQGFDFGDVASMFGGPEDLVRAGVGTVMVKMARKSKSKTLTREEELAVLAEEQARDAKGWARMGGSKPPTEVKEAYKEFGLDIDKLPQSKAKLKEGELQGVRPEPVREPNTSQFPTGIDRTRLYNDEFEQLDVGPKHTQGQADPSATAGLMPQAPASEASRMESAVIFANRRAKQWNSGWDAQAMREQVEKVTKTATREAAKGKAGGKPEFWIYDESADELIKVSRDKKTDALKIKRGKPKEDEAIKEMNEYILWDRATDKPLLDAKGKPQFGNVPVYNDSIDIVVPKEGKEELDKMLYNLAMDMLDKK